jgi:hypothetical protein
MPSQDRGDKSAMDAAGRDEAEAQRVREAKHLEQVVPPEAAIVAEPKVDETDRAAVATERRRPQEAAPERPYSEAMTDEQRELLRRNDQLPPDLTEQQVPQE